jgi:hypothetical protein
VKSECYVCLTEEKGDETLWYDASDCPDSDDEELARWYIHNYLLPRASHRGDSPMDDYRISVTDDGGATWTDLACTRETVPMYYIVDVTDDGCDDDFECTEEVSP